MADEKLPLVDIGNTDENADWIPSPEHKREELALHDALTKRKKAEKK